MRKIVLVLAFLIFTLMYKNICNEFVIPDTSIRLRIIPNSNSTYDQKIKNLVKTYLENNLYKIIEENDNIDTSRKKISEMVPKLEKSVEKIFQENHYDMPFSVDFGYNYFPQKKYRNILYKEGYYESLVIKIGNYEGDNWWCFLFPNICLFDLENNSNINYDLWIKEKIYNIINR